MPIKFEILIEEDQRGIHVRVATPDSVATPLEAKTGLDFKQQINQWCAKCKLNTGWRSPHGEGRTNQ